MPAGELLKQEGMRDKVQDVLRTAYQAGIEVVRDGRVSKETEAKSKNPSSVLTKWLKWPISGGIAISKESPRENQPRERLKI